MSILNIFWTNFNSLELTSERIQCANELLPKDFQVDWSTAKNNQKISFAAKLLLNELVSEHFNLPNCLCSFKKEANGKPYFLDLPLHFNISHSKDLIGIAFSEDSPVGIDIQVHKKFNPLIVDRVFSPEEHVAMKQLPDKEQFFFDTWTKKEAVVKCTGGGIKTGLKTFSVLPDTTIIEGQELFVQNIDIQEGYSAAIASEKSIKNASLIRI